MSEMFLYPKARSYAFDETCELIVRGLEERGWRVPGVPGIELDTYRYAHYWRIDTLWGEDFCLRFGRRQGRLSHEWYDTGAISYICIPERSLLVGEHGVRSRLNVYTGGSWPTVAHRYLGVNRLRPELALGPHLEDCCQYASGGSYFVLDERESRGHHHGKDIPRKYGLRETFRGFDSWLREHVLSLIDG